MNDRGTAPLDALIVALPETAGSALYGMVDVLGATGTLWRQLVGEEPGERLIRPRIVGPSREPFRCGNAIPVCPELGLCDDPEGDIVVVPELWLSPDDDMKGRYPELIDWLRRRYRSGSFLYSACTGAVVLAATGLLNGRSATSHWAYEELFRSRFAEVEFHPEPNLCLADPAGRIVTAGGTTSWHDLAIHIIARHCSPGEALRIAKVYLLKWHGEGQRPVRQLDPPATARRLRRASCRDLAGEDLPRTARGRRGCCRGRHSGADAKAAVQGGDRQRAHRPRAEPSGRGGQAPARDGVSADR